MAPNQSYSQLIKVLAEGVYDIFVDDVTITLTRYEIVNSSLRIMLIVLVAIIYNAFLIYLLKRSDNEILEKRSMMSAIPMTSDLTLSKLEDNISGIDGIKNGKIPFSCKGISAGSSVEDYHVNEISDRRRSFYTSLFGIVLPKQCIYKQDINILSLREVGKWDDSKVKWFQSSIYPVISEISTAMGSTSMSGLFLTLSVICMKDFVSC
ncbi:unnamed protein product [Adineta steineri]|uniref:Uncharacterized protein n=1 Tax=Adineta steineri TaxID=433720 RepID=A0A814VDT7_9BILA|nr:unnamed protein product [Adineta steineri]CAF4200198.1 unnamed protein product [Adineta steineri]